MLNFLRKRAPEPAPDVAPEFLAAAERFKEDGYVVFENAVDHALIDRFWEEMEEALASNPDVRMSVRGENVSNAEFNYAEAAPKDRRAVRVINAECVAPSAPEMMLAPVVVEFFKAWYGGGPTCIQTLTYAYSSQQGAHSDKYFVTPRSVGPAYKRDTLAASWIACEDADEANGALIIYPGSHTLKKKRLKEDFGGNYPSYAQHLRDLCKEAGIKPETFRAKKGDILFWQSDFVHAGGRIQDPERTRKSLVCHYANVPADAASKNPEREKKAFGEGWYYA